MLFCVVVVRFGACVGVVVVMFLVVVVGCWFCVAARRKARRRRLVVLWGRGWGKSGEMVALVWLWGCFVVVPESGVVCMVACYSLGLLTGVCLGWFLFRGVGAITRGK